MQNRHQKVLESNNKIKNDIDKRQERYIKREQEYRKNIEELQAQLRIRMTSDVLPGSEQLFKK